MWINYMNNINKIMLSGLLLGCSQHALALATCTANIAVRNFVANLAPSNITVGTDVPNGAVIYRLDFRDPGTATNAFLCGPGPFSAPQILEYNSTPMPLANWTGTPFPNRVYQTSVPGIGVAVSSDLTNQALPTTAYTTTYTTAGSMYNFNIRINAVLSLIKTGTVSPGTITGATLPTVRLNLGPDATLSNAAIRVYNLSFTGSLNIVSKTCTTPDVNVAMGSYEISKYFTGIGSTTPWKDASINLLNCPVFYGYYNNTSYNTSPGSDATTVNQAVRNTLMVQLSPATPMLNANTFFINSSTSAPAATGVGIQMASGLPQQASSSSLVDFQKITTIPLTSDQGSTVQIPLSARYIQIASTATPGRADGKVVFLINYY